MNVRSEVPMPYSEDWWRVALSSIGDAVIVTDAVGKIAFMNPVAESLTSWTNAEATGKSIQEIFAIVHETTRRTVDSPVSSVIRTGAVAQLANHTVLLARNGAEVFIDDTAAPIKSADGKLFGVVLVFRDISDKKRADAAQQYLAAIVESSDDAIVGKRLDSVITSWNKAAEKMFGYTAAEAVGQKVYLIIPEQRHHEETEILARLKAGERIDHYETVRRKKDGTLIDVSLTISPIKDAEGNILGASKIARDITERKKVESQLRDEREALETLNRVGQMLSSDPMDLQKLVQTITDSATAVTGAAFGAFFYNVIDERGASYMLYTLSGVPREHFANFPMPRSTDLFGPTFRGEGVIRIDDVKQDRRYGKNSPYFGMPEGHLPVASYLAVPVRSRSGEVLGGLFFGHPQRGVFTERHEHVVSGLAGQAATAMDNARLYEAMGKARLEAETANRLKDEFLATISHELRTPLNAILGWARMLSRGMLDEDTRARAVETIERNAVSQGQLIEDILDVSRIITGKLRLDVSPIEIRQLVADAVESIRPTAEAKGVRLQTILDTNANLIRGDSHRLQQVFWNLLSNAIKFTPRGGRVQVSLSRIDSHVEISINDTGQGIKREFLPYVFDRFRQADSSMTRSQGGLGLGLAIVRHLTELHGGTVTAASDGENTGATFTVLLPLAILRQTKRSEGQRTAFPPAIASGISAGSEHALTLKGVRVLIVDDEADARELLRVVLAQSGAEIRLASSTAEALATFREWKPDVLVSDIGMPYADGYELIRQVRSLPQEKGGSIAAAALTAYATAEDRLRVLTAGFQIHVAKPVEPLELLAVVASLAGRTGKATDRA